MTDTQQPHHPTDEADADARAYLRGSMAINEQSATWDLFMFLAKYGSLAIAAVVAWLVVWFAVGAGLIAGFVTGAVIMAAGIVFLREKPQSH